MSNENSNEAGLVTFGINGLQKIANSLRIAEKLIAANKFDSVAIGKQEWMLKNLDVSKFRNGDPIPEIQDPEAWENAGNEGFPAWCHYDNDPKNDEVYGKLYNWHAVIDQRGLAPLGWHIPSWEDWEYLGISEEIEKAWQALYLVDEWIPRKRDANETTFSITAGAVRNVQGKFKLKSEKSSWWSSKEIAMNTATRIHVHFHTTKPVGILASKGEGTSVRCVRQKPLKSI